MFQDIKENVHKALLELFQKGLVIYNWGNASQLDDSRHYMIIKPSGINYNVLTPDDMVVVELFSGKVIEGKNKPSSDTPIHLELYRRFESINGIVHTHSVNAVAFAQAGMDIKVLGTTHADCFLGDIPCTRVLNREEVNYDYETNTGKVIVETIKIHRDDPLTNPGVIVRNHGLFTWGTDISQAVFYADVIERIAEMNIKTLCLNPHSKMPDYLCNKHWSRKHGLKAYYGQ